MNKRPATGPGQQHDWVRYGSSWPCQVGGPGQGMAARATHENHCGRGGCELPVRIWNIYASFQAALLRLAHTGGAGPVAAEKVERDLTIIGIARTEQTNTATRRCAFRDRFVIDYVANL